MYQIGGTKQALRWRLDGGGNKTGNAQRAKAIYAWVAEGGPVNFDKHGEDNGGEIYPL